MKRKMMMNKGDDEIGQEKTGVDDKQPDHFHLSHKLIPIPAVHVTPL
jgi:hypothetical protein